MYFSVFSNGQTRALPLKKAQETSDIPSVDYCENNSTYVLVEDLLASKHKALVDRTRRQILGYSFI